MNVHRIYQVISPRFRRRRMRWMVETLRLQANEKILDIGGLPVFWEETRLPNPIVLLNRSFPADIAASLRSVVPARLILGPARRHVDRSPSRSGVSFLRSPYNSA